MILVIAPEAPEVKIHELMAALEKTGLTVQRNNGVEYSTIHLFGDTSRVEDAPLRANGIVHRIIRVQEPYKKANRLFHTEDTVIQVGEHSIGGKELAVMAGPCSVESEEQIVTIAHGVKAAGAQYLRGGAYKPRTSPYSFQGLGEKGLDHLMTAKAETGLKIVTEILSADQLDRFVKDVDIIQVGARNMQNYTLLKELGKVKKPILLKRGMSATIEEWLMSAEYIMSEGNEEVILCERGIRTFEAYTRNTLDLSAVPMIKRMSHLPVVVDPSHAAGISWMVEPLARGAVSVGADGIMIEVHNDPEHALSDAAQQLKPEAFLKMMESIRATAAVQGRTLLPI